MQSKAATVAEYLASLPEDRRAALTTLRKVFRDNMNPGFEEAMGYGMPGWVVPHSIFPHGYHCDPRQALPFAGMASQKGYMSLYMMCMYGNEGETRRFQEEWKRTGKKLDMGKSCVRFKSIDDVPLAVVGAAIKRMTVQRYIDMYTKNLALAGKGPDGKPLKTGGGRTGARAAAKGPTAKRSAASTVRKTVKKTAKKAGRVGARR